MMSNGLISVLLRTFSAFGFGCWAAAAATFACVYEPPQG